MNPLRQILAVTWINLLSLPARLGTSLVIVVGIAGVVAVLMSVLAMAVGYQESLGRSGRLDRAIVVRQGSTSEIATSIARDAALTIMDAPGVAHGPDGKPIASAEAVVSVQLPSRRDDTEAEVILRGAGPGAPALRPELRLIAGRMLQPGLRELVVGRSAAAEFRGLALGNRVTIGRNDWTVVGIFESNRSSHESELIGDADTVLAAYRRNAFQSVTVRLESPEAFATFKDALTSNPTLSVDVKRETDYYAEQSRPLARLLGVVAFGIGGIMAVGALFGALNTMYAAVSARALEIATLRAIGFGAGPVVISVFVEGLLLALAGGLLGAAIAWLAFNGHEVSTRAGGFTQLVFPLAVTPGLAVLGIVWAATIGFLGGIFPALRAARLPVATALRTV